MEVYISSANGPLVRRCAA